MEEAIGTEAPALNPAILQTSVMPEGEIRLIRLEHLRESPWNPRQYFPEAEMAELVESMKQSGFRAWQPLLVRQSSEILDGQGFEIFEIGAGHRRSRAAREAGLEVVPCIVRDLTDEQFLDVLNFDNSQREDVHPLHEAAGWRQWMEKTGKGVNDIAARIGQSAGYVYQRLKYSALVPVAREAFLDQKITDGHAILIARLQPNDQKKALKFCEPPQHDPGRRPSVRELAAFIQRGVHLDMARATFDKSDATLLVGAGTCDACPKRTKNSPELILEAVSGREIDECTDPGCFNMKLTNHIIQIKTSCQKAGKEAIEVSSSWSKPKKGVLSRHEYSITTDTKVRGAKLALVIDGINAGELIAVLVRPAPQPAASKTEDSEAAAQRTRDAAESKARVDCERSVRVAILKAVREKITAGSNLAKWEIADLVRIALDGSDVSSSGVAELCRIRGIALEEPVDDWDDSASDAIKSALPSLSHEEMVRLAIELPVARDLDRHVIARNEPASGLIELARAYRVDAVKIRRDVEASVKSAQGGTRRELAKRAPEKKSAKATAKKAAQKKAKPVAAKKAKAAKKSAKAKAKK